MVKVCAFLSREKGETAMAVGLNFQKPPLQLKTMFSGEEAGVQGIGLLEAELCESAAA